MRRPSLAALVLLVQIELAPGTTAEQAYDEIGRALDDGAQAVRQVVDGFGDVERTAVGLGESRSDAFDDDGFACHGILRDDGFEKGRSIPNS